MSLRLTTHKLPQTIRRRTTTKRRSTSATRVVVNAAQKDITPDTFNYKEFAETVNGRCAMQGFIWGSVKEALTHDSIMQQIFTKTATGMSVNPTGVLEFSAIVSLVTMGTVFTSVLKDADGYTNETFTSEAEKLNARAAMVGFILLSLIHFQ